MRDAVRLEKGFTIIEVLIAFFIISVTLVGATRMIVESQKQVQQLSQRTLALQLANDLLARISANPDALDQYDDAIPSKKSKNCAKHTCTEDELASYDLWNWNKKLQGENITQPGATADADRINAGGLVLPTACRSVNTNNRTVEITMVWRGKEPRPDQHTTNHCGLNDSNYKEYANNDVRRLLVIATRISG